MVDFSKAMKGNSRMRVLTDDVLDGFTLNDIECRSCSGYGNCGYKSYYLTDNGVASVCMRRRKQLQCKRDGIEYVDGVTDLSE